MIAKPILFFDTPSVVVCDAQCDKAWGINTRPRVYFDDLDDYAFMADSELDIAPVNPGTYEGGYGKPQTHDERLNKWCVRECECHVMYHYDEGAQEIVLPDYSQRVYNQPDRHAAPQEGHDDDRD